MCRPPAPAPAPAHVWPWRAVVVLCLGNAAHFFAICSLFSYAGFLCVDLGWSRDRDHAGFVAGWLGTALTLGRIPTAVAWGAAADRFGRRPCLLASLTFVGVGNVAFGLCRSLPAALAARFVFLGLLNGWVSLIGTFTAEVAGADRQNDVSALVLSTGALVQLVGPAVAAIIYGVPVFGLAQFPALAPSLLGAGLALLAVVTGLFWLPETKGPAAAASAAEVKGETVIVKVVTQANEEDASPRGARSPGAVPLPLRRNKQFVVGTALRTILGLSLFATFDSVPLWAIATKASGGLALSRRRLAVVLSLAAAAQMLFTTTLMARCMRRLGNRDSLITSASSGAAAIALVPFVWLVRDVSYGAVVAALAPLLAAYYSAGCVSFAATTALINDSVPTETRGTANGFAAMFEAVGKATGPTLGATLLATGLTRAPGLGGAGGTFWVLAACQAATALLTTTIQSDRTGSPPTQRSCWHWTRTARGAQPRGAAAAKLPTYSILHEDDDDDEDARLEEGDETVEL
ncbi:major facilitator superfamily domain-containing protein [Pelagophyceae sp. CCMP2097]|nr:major facilitator superfamily domain-containing protein [Pelagophyceae sp. CCMP2097]